MTNDDITSARWSRIRELFAAAEGLDELQWRDFLLEHCPDDEGARQEVLNLLATSRQSDGMLQGAISAAAAELIDEHDYDPRPELLGSYRVLGVLGRGGMGTVYHAERADDQFVQKVAIKVVDSRRASPELLERFRSERQILAALDHPYVARLLDGGETENGVPFLVMELVEGTPIDRYCEERDLSLEERLHLFCKVCSAIEYAHRNLIVHRDVKPSNILVRDDGTPKLLDFGIAKLLKPETAGYNVFETVENSRPMTPKHASPEQIRGETITTAADVYALGVLLYLLLTRRFPFEPSQKKLYELERMICETEPSPPSTMFGSDSGVTSETDTGKSSKLSTKQIASLRRRLRGDLDNIVLVALRKEPERRYATVRQLADDVQNFLTDKPVSARGDSFAYRARKFLKRNTLGVVTAVGVVITIAALVTVYTVQLTEERDRVRLEADKSRQVAAFLTELFKEADPRQSAGNPITATDLLDRGADRISTELSDQPELQAALMATIGESYRFMWNLERAKTHLADSIDVAEPQLGPDHPDIVKMRYLLGMAMSFQSDYDEALPLHEQNYALIVEQYGRDSLRAATELHQIAFVEYQLARYELAEEHFLELIDIFRNAGIDGRDGLALGLMEYGSLLRNLDRRDEAEDVLLEALEIRRVDVGEKHPDYAGILNNVANHYYGKGDLDQAEAYMQENVALNREIYGDDSIPYGVAIANYSNLLQDRGQYEVALTNMRTVEEIYRAEYGADSVRFALARESTANVLTGLERHNEAEDAFREAIDLLVAKFDEQHSEPAITRLAYGGALLEQQRFDDAVVELLIAHESLDNTFGPSHRRTLNASNRLGKALHGANRSTEAVTILESTVAHASQAANESERWQITILRSLASVLSDLDRHEESNRKFLEAIAVWQQSEAVSTPELFVVERDYALSLAAQGQFVQAEQRLLNRYGAFEAKFGTEAEETKQVSTAIVDLYEAWDKPDLAQGYRE